MFHMHKKLKKASMTKVGDHHELAEYDSKRSDGKKGDVGVTAEAALKKETA